MHEVAEGGSAVVSPGEGWFLHTPDGADAGGAPTCEFAGDLGQAVIDGSDGDGRYEVSDGFGVSEDVGKLVDGLHVDEAVEAGELEAGIGIVDDGPGSGVRALPDADTAGQVAEGSFDEDPFDVFAGGLGAEFVDGAAGSDGGGVSDGNLSAGILEFASGEFGGEMFGDAFGRKGTVVLDVDDMRGRGSRADSRR